jgi:oxygen-independent coproporphyrinogen-3 oxidase
MALMCQGVLDFQSIEATHSIAMEDYFASELTLLQRMSDAGLVRFAERAVQVTASGWYLVRAIAMVFDRHLQQAKERHRFSRVI